MGSVKNTPRFLYLCLKIYVGKGINLSYRPPRGEQVLHSEMNQKSPLCTVGKVTDQRDVPLH